MSEKRAELLLACVIIARSTSFVFNKLGLGTMTAFNLLAVRFLLAFALLALVPIWLYRGRQGCHSKPFQYACYAFYPVHMLLLVLVLNFVNR